ncbi:MAG: hypothetical protein M0C28_03885 [Candidatus Moduliflexus flocculans]|nr:hypothetical protein [Candidatus Moduliflexus flocculans]
MGVLAGLYPAFFLSSLKQTEVLKGSPLRRAGTAGALALRNGLVVFQFAMSVLLIIGSLVIGRQLDFIKNQRLGLRQGQRRGRPQRRQPRPGARRFPRAAEAALRTSSA